MKTFAISFFLSFFISGLTIRFTQKYRYFLDRLDNRTQRFHHHQVTRIGGLAIFISIFIVSIVLFFFENGIFDLLFPVICLSGIVFLVGFIEDINKNIPSWVRIILIFFSIASLVFVSGVRIPKTDFYLIDLCMHNKLFVFLFTVLSISSLVNAFNIIDGYNGLSSMVAIIALLSCLATAIHLNDNLIIIFSVIGVASIMGFFIWNWPFGKIFLGDGGAYLIGCLVSLDLILLISRNAQVSAWYAPCVVSYPLIELFFSIYRKTLRKTSPIAPDGIHLHMLVYKRILKWMYIKDYQKSNSYTSPIFWLFSCVSAVLSNIYYANKAALIGLFFINAIIYLTFYFAIVKFKLFKLIKLFGKYDA